MASRGGADSERTSRAPPLQNPFLDDRNPLTGRGATVVVSRSKESPHKVGTLFASVAAFPLPPSRSLPVGMFILTVVYASPVKPGLDAVRAAAWRLRQAILRTVSLSALFISQLGNFGVASRRIALDHPRRLYESSSMIYALQAPGPWPITTV